MPEIGAKKQSSQNTFQDRFTGFNAVWYCPVESFSRIVSPSPSLFSAAVYAVVKKGSFPWLGVIALHPYGRLLAQSAYLARPSITECPGLVPGKDSGCSGQEIR
jgi:hypothetical protein